MTCICDHAGYCPLMRTQFNSEQWEQCRTDPAWHDAERTRRGIRTEGQPGDMKPKKQPPPVCPPCEAAKAESKAAVGPLTKFVATKPVVTNSRGRPALGLRDAFAGQPVFLLGGGPSLRSVDLTQLQGAGIATAAMNNVATMLRPTIFFSVDMPRNFHETIWRDPGVLKFTFDKHIASKRSVDSWNGTEYVQTGLRVNECPNVWGFDHRHGWDAKLFLDDSVPTWGPSGLHEHADGKHNTVMLPALWLLYWLGFRTVYLLGCDFSMGDGKYAFDQAVGASNTLLWPWLGKRLAELDPHFRQHGFEVYNCTAGSALEAFERRSLDEAIAKTLATWPKEIVTAAHYRGP